MDRMERLTNLLALLLESRPLTLDQIMLALDGQYTGTAGGRRAAFERDKAALREIGVQIETRTVQGSDRAGASEYWIDRDRYELHDLDLDPDDERALQVALAATRPGSRSAQEALWKIGAGMIEGPGAVSAILPDDPALPVLRAAMTDRRAVTFEYRGVVRTVDPWGLLLRGGFWYLVGFDHVRGEQRTFRLDRRTGEVAAVPDSSFERPAGFHASAELFTDPRLVGTADNDRRQARVRVDPGPAATVEAELGTDRVVARHPDGAIDVDVPYTNEAAMRAWVLGFADHAVVLDPPELRESVIAWLQATAGAS